MCRLQNSLSPSGNCNYLIDDQRPLSKASVSVQISISIPDARNPTLTKIKICSNGLLIFFFKSPSNFSSPHRNYKSLDLPFREELFIKNNLNRLVWAIIHAGKQQYIYL